MTVHRNSHLLCWTAFRGPKRWRGLLAACAPGPSWPRARARTAGRSAVKCRLAGALRAVAWWCLIARRAMAVLLGVLLYARLVWLQWWHSQEEERTGLM